MAFATKQYDALVAAEKFQAKMKQDIAEHKARLDRDEQWRNARYAATDLETPAISGWSRFLTAGRWE